MSGTFYRKLDGPPIVLTTPPRLASWDRAGDRDAAAVQLEQPLALDVSLEPRMNLLGHHDLDNYVYPLAKQLAQRTAREFAAVWASKRHGDHSKVCIGPA